MLIKRIDGEGNRSELSLLLGFVIFEKVIQRNLNNVADDVDVDDEEV